VQQKVLESGFRPVNPSISLDSANSPFAQDLGVVADQPTTVLTVPDPEVIAAIQSSWQFVKKQADVLLVIDISGSMEGDKLEQAKQAALAFLDRMPTQNRVGLVVFDDQIDNRVPLTSFEGAGTDIRAEIEGLVADGDTALFQAIIQAIEIARPVDGAEEDDRIKAIVILSDGEDTASDQYGVALNDVVTTIQGARGDRNPVLVIPVAYGSDADINALNAIARASSTKVQSGDPNDIQQVLEIISSYF
jgi:Ca-activated chloride channel family protein